MRENISIRLSVRARNTRVLYPNTYCSKQDEVGTRRARIKISMRDLTQRTGY